MLFHSFRQQIPVNDLCILPRKVYASSRVAINKAWQFVADGWEMNVFMVELAPEVGQCAKDHE